MRIIKINEWIDMAEHGTKFNYLYRDDKGTYWLDEKTNIKQTLTVFNRDK